MASDGTPEDGRKRPRQRGVRETADGAQGVIYACVPIGLARDAKMLAIEQSRPLRELVAEALREYIARVDAQPAPGTQGRASVG